MTIKGDCGANIEDNSRAYHINDCNIELRPI